jgi:hypothetical protein
MLKMNYAKAVIILSLILILISGCKSSCDKDKLPYYDFLEEDDLFEFCVPNSIELVDEVKAIVPDAYFLEGSSGQIDCDPEQEILVLIDKDTLEADMCELTKLDYIKNISVSGE